MDGPDVLTCAGFADGVRWTPGERLEQLFEARCDALRVGGRVDHPAVDEGAEVLTFDALDRRANRLARLLRERGVRAGDRVAVLVDRSASTEVALLGVLKAGAAYVPLDAGYPVERLRYIVGDADAGTLLSLGRFRPHLEGVPGRQVFLDEEADALAAQSDERLPPHPEGVDEDPLCYVIYTSGSTGRPKGVAVHHASICNFVRVAAEAYGVRDTDRFYQGMTIAFDFSVEELWVPLLAGATLVPNTDDVKLVGEDLGRFLAERRITAMCCVPTLLATLEDDLPELRWLLVSGEACPHDLVARWHRDGRTILNAYGPTEATVTCTWAELSPGKPVTIGQPLPTYSAVILEEGGTTPVPRGRSGELCIGGVGLAAGYVGRPDLTEKAFIPDPVGVPDNPSGRLYRTGDRARITDEGEIEYQGRIDLQVKVRGYRIELTEIENVLLEVPAIAQAVVDTWTPEGASSPELVAWYTLREGAEEPAPDELARALRVDLPPYMVPAFFERLDEIPMLPSDKADRKNLPAPRRGRATPTGDGHVEPADELEAVIVELLAELVGVERVSVTDDFFDALGAHSLLLAKFCARFREETGRQVSMRDVYLETDARRLAARIRVLEREAPVDAAPPRPQYIAPRRHYVACGVAQVAALLLGLAPVYPVFDVGWSWIDAAPGPFAWFARAAAVTLAIMVVGASVPVFAKWLLVGAWSEEDIPVWSARYFRFWIMRTLLRANPMVLFKGYPLYNAWLRALGARIGNNVVVDCKFVPVCTDLLEIGSDTILRKDSLLSGYRAERGWIRIEPISIGRGCFVGEGSVVDVGTRMEDGAQLGHASSLQPGQVIPAGESWHGSPAQRCRTRYCDLEPHRITKLRRMTYSAWHVGLWLLTAPLFMAIYHVLWTVVTEQAHEHPWIAGPILGAILLLAAYVIELVAVLVVPRVLHRFQEVGKPRPMYGVHFFLFRLQQVAGNSRALNLLFGDSSAIVHYLNAVGWDLHEVYQTGSNFGVQQRQDDPLLCGVGSQTMVSDGLSMMNVQMTPKTFVLRRAEIGARNYLGNNLYYPPDSRVGDNCLLATKAMVPIDGPVREGIGLLGSPPFHIPRVAEPDREAGILEDERLRVERLPAKNRHNLRSALIHAFNNMVVLTLMLSWLFTGDDAYEHHDNVVATACLALMGVSVIAYMALAERMSLGFRRLAPLETSIYDPAFWRVERYWKSGDALIMSVLPGTPLKNVVTRALGVRIGRQVFDDGAYVTERTLAEIGDHCTLNESVTLQSHSLEEGLFKCDRIRIGARCSLGPNAFVHYGVEMGDDTVLATDAFLMKGEAPPAGSVWGGNPARALHLPDTGPRRDDAAERDEAPRGVEDDDRPAGLLQRVGCAGPAAGA